MTTSKELAMAFRRMDENLETSKEKVKAPRGNVSRQAAAGIVQTGAQAGSKIIHVYLSTTVRTVSVPVSAIERHLDSSGSVSLLGRFSEFLVFGSIPIGIDNFVGSKYDFTNVIVVGSIISFVVGLALWLLSRQIKSDHGKELREYIENAKE